jgi:hypothetical protein
VVTDMLAEADLSADEDLAAFLTALHALGRGPAPTPAPPLTTRLGLTPLPTGGPRLRRRVVGGASALALTFVAATGAAAAANELPTGVQRLVARFSERFLPFDFPSPVESGRLLQPGTQGSGTHQAGTSDGRRAPAGQPPRASGREIAAGGEAPLGAGHHSGVPSAGDERAASDDIGGSRQADDGGERPQAGAGSERSGAVDGSRDDDGAHQRSSGDTQDSEPATDRDDGSERSDGSAGTAETDSGSESTDGSGDQPDDEPESGESSPSGG